MTLRRPSWSSSALRHPEPLILRLAARVGPSRRWRKSGDVERRHSFASLTTHNHNQLLFHNLLAALQRKDLPGTSSAFFTWIENFDESLPTGHEDLGQFHEVSSPVMSEILRSMDPVRRPELDVVHFLSISQGGLWSTDVGKFIDDFGVRKHHRRAVEAVQKIMRLRGTSRIPLQPTDFDVILRIAGSSVEYSLPPIILDQRKELGRNFGTAVNWVEFLKARFMTDPVYYQNNRSSMVLSARQRVDHEMVRTEPEMVKQLDTVRYSLNHFTRQPWNRRRDRPEDDIRRLLRRSGENFAGYLGHWLRMHALKVDVDVEFLSVSIEAFARSDSRQPILDFILRDYYGIAVDEETGIITGGFDLARDSVIYPTPRLQHAIVEAFGAMGDISLAMQLIDFISQRYGVPIPAEIWSNLLSWTFVCASKNNASYRRKWNTLAKSVPDIRVGDVLHVWKLMTSPPYNIEPSFQDLDIHIRAQIIAHLFEDAIQAIRERAIPFYNMASQELEEAIADEMMLDDFVAEHYPDHSQINQTAPPTTVSSLNAARRRRHEAEVHKDFVTHHINMCLDDLLKEASKSRNARTSTLMTVTVPDLLHDLPHFFLHGAQYRTATGRVSIRPPSSSSPRFHGPETVEREVLRTKLGAAHVHNMGEDALGNRRMILHEASDKWIMNPDFVWPTTREMRVREVRRRPRTRPAIMELPPKATTGEVGSSPSATWRHWLENQLAM